MILHKTVEAAKVVDVSVVLQRQVPTIRKVLNEQEVPPSAFHRQGCRGVSGVGHVSHDSAEDCRDSTRHILTFVDVPAVLQSLVPTCQLCRKRWKCRFFSIL